MRFWTTETLDLREPEDGEADAGEEVRTGAAPEQISAVEAENKCGAELAIKRLVGRGVGGDSVFSAEAGTLGRIRHRNIVRLLGFVSNRNIVSSSSARRGRGSTRGAPEAAGCCGQDVVQSEEPKKRLDAAARKPRRHAVAGAMVWSEEPKKKRRDAVAKRTRKRQTRRRRATRMDMNWISRDCSCYKFIRWCQVEVQHCSFKDWQVEQSIVAYDEAHKPTLKMALLLGDAISDLPKEYIQVGNGLDAHGTQKPTRTGVFVCSDLNAGRGGLMGEGLAGEAQGRPPT